MKAVLPSIYSFLSAVGVVALHIFIVMCSNAIFTEHTFIAVFLADAVIVAFCAFLTHRLRKNHVDPKLYVPAGNFSVPRTSVAIVIWLICVYMLITVALFITNLYADPEMESRQQYFENQYAISPFLQFIFTCVIAPATEEFIYRYCIYNMMKDKCHWITAMVMSAFLFGAMHGTIAHIIFGTLFGCILVLIYENTGRHIVITMICHSLYNVVASHTLETSYPSGAVAFWAYVSVLAVLIAAASIKTNRLFGLRGTGISVSSSDNS